MSCKAGTSLVVHVVVQDNQRVQAREAGKGELRHRLDENNTTGFAGFGEAS
jgi:hypothetical protein